MKLFKKKSCCGQFDQKSISKAIEKQDVGARIKVLGANCSKCKTLKDNVKDALMTSNHDQEIDYITDYSEIALYGVMTTPALVIDGKVVSFGKVLSKDEVIELFKKVGFYRKKKIAFICVHNSCRSQMAEAIGKKLLSNRYDFYSCGSQIKPQINQDAVRLIKELYDIDMEKSQYSKLVDEIGEVDIAISMGCDVECPYIGKEFDDNWQLDDPTGKDDEFFKEIISQIETRIKSLDY